MIISQDGLFYNVDKSYTEEEITQNINNIQAHIDNLEGVINSITYIDTTGLTGDILTAVEAENENRRFRKEDLEVEVEMYREELTKWQ